MKPAYFRRDPEARGFSVDRVLPMGPELLKSGKCADARYNGYLQFIAARAKDLRDLLEQEKRLFCVYDSGTAENNFHADICQNLIVEPGAPNRRMAHAGHRLATQEHFLRAAACSSNIVNMIRW